MSIGATDAPASLLNVRFCRQHDAETAPDMQAGSALSLEKSSIALPSGAGSPILYGL
jgi:hypothetical protein